MSATASDGPKRPYRGRFAPSPSGALHLGSAVAAIASWLDARAHGGDWLVRIDDLDPPRSVAGASDAILRDLERLGLSPDAPVVYQSTQTERYADALMRLRETGKLFDCACSRKLVGKGPYPGTCRAGVAPGRAIRSQRIDVATTKVNFDDRLCGAQHIDLGAQLGAFVVRRADGIFAYHLATVVDDWHAGITDVVRGADLLDSTAPQIQLQVLLRLPVPRYAHVPMVTHADGQKLSKQSHATPINSYESAYIWHAALKFLGLIDDFELVDALTSDYKLVGLERWHHAHASRTSAKTRSEK
jgi:glutamyl-Q tRNA(Asp) synthetase